MLGVIQIVLVCHMHVLFLELLQQEQGLIAALIAMVSQSKIVDGDAAGCVQQYCEDA